MASCFCFHPVPPQPQPTSFHLRFHLLFFPFFLSISSSVSPSWVPRPLCVALSDLSFLRSLTHTHISLSPTTHTDWTSHSRGLKTKRLTSLTQLQVSGSFLYCRETNLRVAAALNIEADALADLAWQGGSYVVDESRNSVYMPGWSIVLMFKSDAFIVWLAVRDHTLVMIQGNVCVCDWKSFALAGE